MGLALRSWSFGHNYSKLCKIVHEFIKPAVRRFLIRTNPISYKSRIMLLLEAVFRSGAGARPICLAQARNFRFVLISLHFSHAPRNLKGVRIWRHFACPQYQLSTARDGGAPTRCASGLEHGAFCWWKRVTGQMGRGRLFYGCEFTRRARFSRASRHLP